MVGVVEVVEVARKVLVGFAKIELDVTKHSWAGELSLIFKLGLFLFFGLWLFWELVGQGGH